MRRSVLKGLTVATAGAVGLLGASPPRAQGNWPVRPLRLVVPFPPGGLTDVVARLVAEPMGADLGQSVMVENRPGAGGNIGASNVARAASDGYSLLVVSHLIAINKTAYRQIDYDLEQDFAPIGDIGQSVFFLVVRPDFPARDLKEMVGYMKAHPGKVNFAVAGAGPSAAYFAMTTGTEFLSVPYKGNAPALTDLVAGRVDAIIIAAETVLPYLQSAKVRVLAVTSSTRRSAYFPEIPTATESLPGFVAPGFLGMVTTRGVDPKIVERLSRALQVAQRNPHLLSQFERYGIEAVASGPTEFGGRLREEVARWAAVVKATQAYVN